MRWRSTKKSAKEETVDVVDRLEVEEEDCTECRRTKGLAENSNVCP